MKFWFKFAYQSTIRRRKRTIIIYLGLSFAISMLILLSGIMVGVNDTMVNNSISLYFGNVISKSKPESYELALKKIEKLQSFKNKDLDYVLPRMLFPVLLKNDQLNVPLMVNGVDSEKERKNSKLLKMLKKGNFLEDKDGILLSEKTATSLNVNLKDFVTVVTYEGDVDLEVTGIFETGLENFDSKIAFIDYRKIPEITETGIKIQVSYFLKNLFHSKQFKSKLKEKYNLKNLSFKTWDELLPDISQLVKLNEVAMDIIIYLVVAILGFGIANTLLISVMDRYKQFAILKAIGVKPSEIIVTVISESFYICLASGITGTIIGFIVVLIFSKTGIDLTKYTSHNPHFTINSIIYPRITLYTALIPHTLAIITGLIASIWPAYKVSKEEVVTGMREL